MACVTPGFNAVSPKQSQVVRGSGFGVGIDVDDDDNDNICFFGTRSQTQGLVYVRQGPDH